MPLTCRPYGTMVSFGRAAGLDATQGSSNDFSSLRLCAVVGPRPRLLRRAERVSLHVEATLEGAPSTMTGTVMEALRDVVGPPLAPGGGDHGHHDVEGAVRPFVVLAGKVEQHSQGTATGAAVSDEIGEGQTMILAQGTFAVAPVTISSRTHRARIESCPVTVPAAVATLGFVISTYPCYF